MQQGQDVQQGQDCHTPSKRTASSNSVGEREGLDRQDGRHFAALHLLVDVHLELVARKPNASSALDADAGLLRLALPVAVRQFTPRPAAPHAQLQPHRQFVVPLLIDALELEEADFVAHPVSRRVSAPDALNVGSRRAQHLAQRRAVQLHQAPARPAAENSMLDNDGRLLDLSSVALEVMLADGGDGPTPRPPVTPRALDTRCLRLPHLTHHVMGLL